MAMIVSIARLAASARSSRLPSRSSSSSAGLRFAASSISDPTSALADRMLKKM